MFSSYLKNNTDFFFFRDLKKKKRTTEDCLSEHEGNRRGQREDREDRWEDGEVCVDRKTGVNERKVAGETRL